MNLLTSLGDLLPPSREWKVISEYRGVVRVTRRDGYRYIAVFRFKDIKCTSAYFESPAAAGRAYDRLAYEHLRNRAELNFPDEDPTLHPLRPADLPSNLRTPMLFRTVRKMLKDGKTATDIVKSLQMSPFRKRSGLPYTSKDIVKYIARHEELSSLSSVAPADIESIRKERELRERSNFEAIRSMLKRGKNLTSIMNALNEQKRLTKYGVPFTLSGLYRVIERNPDLAEAYHSQKGAEKLPQKKVGLSSKSNNPK